MDKIRKINTFKELSKLISSKLWKKRKRGEEKRISYNIK